MDFLNILSFIITTVSLLLAIYFYRKTKQQKILDILHEMTFLTLPDDSDIKITSNKEKIRELNFNAFYFENKGNVTITDKDVYPKNPLKIIPVNHGKIVSFEVTESNGTKIRARKYKNELIINLDYINPTSCFSIKVYSSGKDGVTILADLIDGNITYGGLIEKGYIVLPLTFLVSSIIIFSTIFLSSQLKNIVIFILFLLCYSVCAILYFGVISKIEDLKANN